MAYTAANYHNMFNLCQARLRTHTLTHTQTGGKRLIYTEIVVEKEGEALKGGVRWISIVYYTTVIEQIGKIREGEN